MSQNKIIHNKYNIFSKKKKILDFYKNKYKLNIIPVNEVLNHKKLYEYDFSGKLLPILDIIKDMYNVCFKSNFTNNLIKILFSEKIKENDFYFLTDGNKLLIYGFLTLRNNNYYLETVCKNFSLNYSKLCFNLILNVISHINNKNKLIILEVDKTNVDAIDCYRKLGFTGKIVNNQEIIEYSIRGYLIYYFFNGPNMDKNNAKLLQNIEPKIIETPYGNLEFKIRKDINGNVKFIL